MRKHARSKCDFSLRPYSVRASAKMKLKINGTILNVLEAGVENYNKTRPSLVFLHYFGGSSGTWTEVIERLAKDYHCVAPDLRGFGASDALPENFAVKDSAADVSDLISTLGIENFVLTGHSMGGKIALAYAAGKPENLQSLILLAPSPPTPEPMPERERTSLLETRGSRRAAEDTIREITFQSLSAKVFERTVNDTLRASEAAWKAWLETGSREDVSALIGNIAIPVLVAAGADDALITPKLLEREIVRRVKNARLVVVAEAKHLLPLEAPEIIADLIREHCLKPCGF